MALRQLLTRGRRRRSTPPDVALVDAATTGDLERLDAILDEIRADVTSRRRASFTHIPVATVAVGIAERGGHLEATVAWATNDMSVTEHAGRLPIDGSTSQFRDWRSLTQALRGVGVAATHPLPNTLGTVDICEMSVTASGRNGRGTITVAVDTRARYDDPPATHIVAQLDATPGNHQIVLADTINAR